MMTTHRQVIIINGDPMVQEGLKLLLQDLQCEVTIVRNNDDVQQILTIDDACPQLIIVPVAAQDDPIGEHLMNQVRTHYKTDIPVILLENDCDFEIIHNNKSNNVYFSDCSKPKQLRKNITGLLNQVIMPTQH